MAQKQQKAVKNRTRSFLNAVHLTDIGVYPAL